MSRAVVIPPQAQHAVEVLGQRIRAARVGRGWTMEHTAGLLHVSRRTLAGVEAGAPGTAIGTVFHAAVLLGVPLFGTDDAAEIARARREGERLDALLPARVRVKEEAFDDDF